MNLIQMQDHFRGMPDSALHTSASQPGQYQFLAMAEIAERQKIRGAHASQVQASQPTVAQRIMGGNDVPPVESPRMDIGGLAAASNRGDAQPAIGMYAGGKVPAAIGSVQANGVPSVPEGFQRMPDGTVRKIDNVEVVSPRTVKPEPPAQKEPDGDTIYDMLKGTGLFAESGGMFGQSRANRASMLDEFGAKYAAADSVDRITPMLAAQTQERQRNTQMENRDRWLALAQAGLGAAAGTSQDFLTNVVGGAQAGLGALRTGMTEAERRNAAVQTRGDALEQARMTQEAAGAAARRRALDLSLGIESDAEKNDQALATNLYGDRIKLDAEKDINASRILSEELMSDRRLTSEERRNIADNASRERMNRESNANDWRKAVLSGGISTRIAGINEAGANARAGMNRDLQRAQLGADTIQRFSAQADDVADSIASRYKFSDPTTAVTPVMLSAMAQEYTRRVLPIAQAYGVPGEIVRNNPFAAPPPAPVTPPPKAVNRGPTGR